MAGSEAKKPYRIYLYHENSLGLPNIGNESIDAVITAPPYGIGFQAHEWDRALPNQ